VRARRLRLALILTLFAAPAALVARAEWLQPDPSFKDAQFQLRAALRDTLGFGNNVARLDTLAVAHLRLAHLADAKKLFLRVITLQSGDQAARAGLGKLALFADRPAEAESLLDGALEADDTAPLDLLAARTRLGQWTLAAALADSLGQSGRAEMLRKIAEDSVYVVSGAPETKMMFTRSLPCPMLRVKLNGQSVLMAIDTGASDLLIDDYVGRQCKVTLLSGESPTVWDGERGVAHNAMVDRIEIGKVRIDRMPAGVLPLRKWGLMVNPDGERVAGVIGINLLRRFSTVLDFRDMRLELRPRGTPIAVAPGARRIPFELWGENEMMAMGSIGGGRHMAMLVATGIPGCGVAAPPEVFEEFGLRPGMMSRVTKTAGSPFGGKSWAQVTTSGVTLGPISRDHVDGWYGAMDSAEMWRHGVRRDAAVSIEFFKGYRMSIDWDRRELVLEGE
jgi:predicted aspartyl protease